MGTAGNRDLLAAEEQFKERVKPHTFKSLDFCYDEAKASLEAQRQDVQYLGSKAASLLGFEGILVGALFAFWRSFSKASLPPVSAFVMLSIVSLAISASFCLCAYRIRAFKGAPSPRILRERYITWSMETLNARVFPLFLMPEGRTMS